MLQINGRRPEIIALVASTEHGNWSEDRRSSIIVSVHVVPCKLTEMSETSFSYIQNGVTDESRWLEEVTTSHCLNIFLLNFCCDKATDVAYSSHSVLDMAALTLSYVVASNKNEVQLRLFDCWGFTFAPGPKHPHLLLLELGGHFLFFKAFEEGGLPTALAWGAGALGGWAHEKVGG